LALVLALLAPRVAAAEERLQTYEIDVWPDDDSGVATYRLRFEYVAPAGSPKESGFKYFGKGSVDGWKVTDAGGSALSFTPSREASSGEVRLDFSVPSPVMPGGAQVVLVELQQDLRVVCGFTQCSGDVPWAPKFKIPVGRMVVRVHGARADSNGSFQCVGTGDDTVCTRETSSPESLTIPLRLHFGSLDAVGLVLWLGVLGVGAFVLHGSLRQRRALLLRLRGVIPPAAAPAYPEGGTYRAPAVIPAAASAEAELTPEDASSHRRRATLTWLVSLFALAIVAAGVRTPFPMTLTMAFGTGIVVTFASMHAVREKGGTWLLLVPLFAAIGFALAGAFVAVGAAVVSLIGNGIANAPPGSFQGSGSSTSSCGGGGGGGGCGGGGGGGGCGG
jgi:hypothetical protein